MELVRGVGRRRDARRVVVDVRAEHDRAVARVARGRREEAQDAARRDVYGRDLGAVVFGEERELERAAARVRREDLLDVLYPRPAAMGRDVNGVSAPGCVWVRRKRAEVTVRTLGLPRSTSQGHSRSWSRRLQRKTIPCERHYDTRSMRDARKEGGSLCRILCALDGSCSNMSAIAENRHESSAGTTCHPVPHVSTHGRTLPSASRYRYTPTTCALPGEQDTQCLWAHTPVRRRWRPRVPRMEHPAASSSCPSSPRRDSTRMNSQSLGVVAQSYA